MTCSGPPTILIVLATCAGTIGGLFALTAGVVFFRLWLDATRERSKYRENEESYR